MKYKMLIFDADETLFDFSKSERHALENAMLDSKIEYIEQTHLPLYKKINIAIWREFEDGLITQKELKLDRFKRFLSAINSNEDAEKFANDYMSHLSKASFLFPGVQKLIYDLSKTYRLVIVTNGLTRVQKYRIRESVIAHHFERIIISEEIGYAKPDPRIFDEGLKGLSLPIKSEILMIGDSLTSDIPAGINYDIDTCWFNPHNNVNDTLYMPNYTITNLNNILNVLK